MITPFSERFTLRTSSACCSIDIFLWITPRPPARAIAIAIWLSVTVSMAAVIIGIFKVKLSANFVVKSASLGNT